MKTTPATTIDDGVPPMPSPADVAADLADIDAAHGAEDDELSAARLHGNADAAPDAATVAAFHALVRGLAAARGGGGGGDGGADAGADAGAEADGGGDGARLARAASFFEARAALRRAHDASKALGAFAKAKKAVK